ncbi:formylglycine-generating enzyme family protein, partial [Myxococcota bacterium]|nr:formylglycine-generating enzyme family protein [Myxococcota bacterium]
CGTATVMCTADLVWEFPTDCQGEGSCFPWESDQSDCGFCGTMNRSCTATCEWEDWSECENPGECSSGTSEWTTEDCTPLGYIRERSCDSACMWVDGQDCTDQCQLQPNTGTVDFRDEVCIPAGPFYMGAIEGEESYENELPRHTVYLSPYFIDIYPVTNRAYRECVTDGACTPPQSYPEYEDALFDTYPVHYVSRVQALAYCQWEGKTLPTEAQWEKAARGPAPSGFLNPWGDTAGNCTLIAHNTCSGMEPVNAHPTGISPYGVYDMIGNASEWVLDNYQWDYYLNSPELDPTGPGQTGDFSCRGITYYSLFSYAEHGNTYRDGWVPSDIDHYNGVGIRCSRTAFERGSK